MVKNKKVISNTINWSVRSRYGDFNEVKNQTANFSNFYLDVLDLLYLTSKSYNITINHVIALYNSYSKVDNFEINDTPVKFRVLNVKEELSRFINSTNLSKKLLHGQIVELMLRQSTNPNEILGNLIRIKNEIDRDFITLPLEKTTVLENKEKEKIKPKSKTKKSTKTKNNKVEKNKSVQKKKDKPKSIKEEKVETDTTKDKIKTISKENKNEVPKEEPKVESKTKNDSVNSKLSSLLKEAKEDIIKTNDLLSDFL